MKTRYETEGNTLFCFLEDENGLIFQGDVDITGMHVAQVEAAKEDALAKAEITQWQWHSTI